MVVATQNPLEQQGTYPLPEAQLDRFLFKHVLAYPSLAEETAIVASARRPQLASRRRKASASEAAGDAATIAEAVAAVATVRLTDDIVRYIVGVVRATREHRRAVGRGLAALRGHAGRRRPGPGGPGRPRLRDPRRRRRPWPCRPCATG